MKYYGFKTSIFGKAFSNDSVDRKRAYYDSLVRAGRKRARQEGKKTASENAE